MIVGNIRVECVSHTTYIYRAPVMVPYSDFHCYAYYGLKFREFHVIGGNVGQIEMYIRNNYPDYMNTEDHSGKLIGKTYNKSQYTYTIDLAEKIGDNSYRVYATIEAAGNLRSESGWRLWKSGQREHTVTIGFEHIEEAGITKQYSYLELGITPPKPVDIRVEKVVVDKTDVFHNKQVNLTVTLKNYGSKGSTTLPVLVSNVEVATIESSLLDQNETINVNVPLLMPALTGFYRICV